MPTTVMWGERGLVATFFLELSRSPDLERWKQFLRCADFPPTRPGPTWDGLTGVWAVVEPNFGSRGFGSPDLVARLDFGESETVVLFVEAKVATYTEACGNPQSRDARGYNSCINGQLELNHRLALALARGVIDGQIRDCDAICSTRYVARDRVRYVNDYGVLNTLVPRLSRLPICRYYHLAITSDVSNPFTALPAPGFLPEIIVDGDDQDVWQVHSCRFGWTCWSRLKVLAESWDGQDFLAAYNVNQHYLPAAAPPGEVGFAALEPDRPATGVSLVLIPNIDPDTALHFSWNANNCAVRNYLNPTLETHPLHPLYRRTAAVLPIIAREERLGRQRPPYNQLNEWRALIERTNQNWDL